MKRLIPLMLLFSLAINISVRAQYSVNYDMETVAAMASAYGAEAAMEKYYSEQLGHIHEDYQTAELATAGILSGRYLERKAMTELGIWGSRTENYYYRRIYGMVSARIMPKIWDVTRLMLRSPHQALYWGSYIYEICDETRQLCYQFESIVTNSSLSFDGITFLEVNPTYASLLRLRDLGGLDWRTAIDNLTRTTASYTRDALRADIDRLYSMGAGLATAGMDGSDILGNSTFAGLFRERASAVTGIVESMGNLIGSAEDGIGGTFAALSETENAVSRFFRITPYNMASWSTDYARESMGQYYTQRWYIYREEKGKETIFDYYPSDTKSGLQSDEWLHIVTTDPYYRPTKSDSEKALVNSESHAGWSRERIKELNARNDGYTYAMTYSRLAYTLSFQGEVYGKCYAYEIHVTRSWNRRVTVYEETFDSYSMSLEAFQAMMATRLAGYNENEDGGVYYIASDPRRYYQTTDARKIAGAETATISLLCSDNARLGEGSTQYKCSTCSGSFNDHTRDCAMMTTITEYEADTSDIDRLIREAENALTDLRDERSQLEEDNRTLIKIMRQVDDETLARLREEYNRNIDRIEETKAEEKQLEKTISDYQDLREEILNGEEEETDDYYRIPAIMQEMRNTYGLQWQEDGSWDGNTFSRTGRMPDINADITFTATVTIARSPKYVLGIKIHRAIVQIEWKLSADYSESQVLEIIELDPSMSDEKKADIVNGRISEIRRTFPDCDVTVEYLRSDGADETTTQDTYHLLWSSDRLEIAREIDSRITQIYADLVSLEKMMNYRHSIIDVLKGIAPYISQDQGRKLTISENSRRRWLRNAADVNHSDTYNSKYDTDDDE